MHLAMRRQRNIAKVAMARRLGVRLYPGASKKQVEKAMKGHVLASGELVGK